jgi:hypothetical protein
MRSPEYGWPERPAASGLQAGRDSFIVSLSAGPGRHHLIRPRVSEEGLEVPISVVARIRDLTAGEDAALLAALDLEGSPLAGGRIRLAGPAGGGRRAAGGGPILNQSDINYTGQDKVCR